MIRSLSRRGLVAGVSSLLCAASLPAGAVGEDDIASVERRHGGRLGVFVLDTGSGRVLAHRADERFLLCSTFKGVLAGLVLQRIDAGLDTMTSLVTYGRRDLLSHSPVTAAHVAEGALPVEALCAAIAISSDNAAANLLLARVGGPASLTAFARGLGDQVTRFDRYELAVGKRWRSLDTTTPRAIVGTVRALLLGDVLRPGSRTKLEAWMVASDTGRGRLRASFPMSWTVGDKSGTSDGACNDYAIARRVGRPPMIMAAYHDAPGMTIGCQEAVLREAGALIVDWAG